MEKSTKSNNRYVGILKEHGEAPYKFNEQEKQQSYYVTLEKNNGSTVTLWGNHIATALQESGAEKGHLIELKHIGQVPVTVKIPVKDENGKESFEIKESHLNKWETKILQTNAKIQTQQKTNIQEQEEQKELVQKHKKQEKIAAQQNDIGLVHASNQSEFALPPQIEKNYVKVEKKFFAKDSKTRVMFEDHGEKIATSTTDKIAIADMVAFSKAKGWSSLKLSGSQEFRKEVWLQAESQGIKTQGYTPKEYDLVELQKLREQRSTNIIQALEEREKSVDQKESIQQEAPRHNINKNQAVMHNEALQNITTNMQTLRANPSFTDRSIEDISTLAYWRGIVMEENKEQPASILKEIMAKFDKQAEDPQFLKRLGEETAATISNKTIDMAKENHLNELEQTL